MNTPSKTKGQVSIFLVFLFQVLFVFFAMVINVGMLVYYKINLQNSVDLAAYYAGMKQAEMLNVIGHINYQIHQSWKLLAYRATILGTLSTIKHPANPINEDNPPRFNQPPGEVPYSIKGERGVPVFCITDSRIYGNYMNGSAKNSTDNQCKNDDDYLLSGFKIPDVIWSLPGFNSRVREAGIQLQDQFLTEFNRGGFRNYNLLASFITLFRADSMNRRKVIAVLANKLSADTSDFPDIEANSVFQGATKVLQKNLSEQNRDSGLSVQLYNSLANSGCGGANTSKIENLPPWLKEIEVAAVFAYFDSKVNDEIFDGKGKAAQNVRYILQGEDSLPGDLTSLGKVGMESYLLLNTYIDISGFKNNPAGRWTSAVGVEKNPWCLPYIGIKASSNPKLPFMPARFSPTLQAKAFSKPFGSRIGPWYGKTWSDRSANSTSDRSSLQITDKLLPPRIYEEQKGLPSLTKDETLRSFPNYSRFIGDRYGLLSQAARFGYGKFYRTEAIPSRYYVNMWKNLILEAFQKNDSPNSEFFLGPLNGDILAEAFPQKNEDYFPDDLQNALKYAEKMRSSELSVIAPDLFDITYYTIEPRFDQYILPNLDAFIKKFDSEHPNLLVRGDLGWRKPTTRIKAGIAEPNMNVEKQINQFASSSFYSDTKDIIFQIITKPDLILTSWAERSIIDYSPSISADKIGNCTARVPAGTEPWTPGACVRGGRTGYSIKLISKKFLMGEIPDIGGKSVKGLALNPPDPSF